MNVKWTLLKTKDTFKWQKQSWRSTVHFAKVDRIKDVLSQSSNLALTKILSWL